MSQSKRDHHLVVTQDMYDYILSHSLRESPEVQGLREATSKHPWARMMGAPDEAQLLGNIAKIMGARKMIEVGTFTGYTALVLAQALPDDGKLVCLDVSTEYTEIGRRFWESAGVSGRIDLVIGPALDSLDKMLDNGEEGEYDFAFIDADKLNYDNYYERLLKLVRKNGVIVVDNTLWGGAVVRPHEPEDENTAALKTINDKLAGDQRVDISFLGIADGVTILRKK